MYRLRALHLLLRCPRYRWWGACHTLLRKCNLYHSLVQYAAKGAAVATKHKAHIAPTRVGTVATVASSADTFSCCNTTERCHPAMSAAPASAGCNQQSYRALGSQGCVTDAAGCITKAVAPHGMETPPPPYPAAVMGVQLLAWQWVVAKKSICLFTTAPLVGSHMHHAAPPPPPPPPPARPNTQTIAVAATATATASHLQHGAAHNHQFTCTTSCRTYTAAVMCTWLSNEAPVLGIRYPAKHACC